ncbi:MAG: hypothetical protein IH585_02475 [Anaerolineaceae bacterium]|nr:hypothetical protein [Anaerolineaceae bacterium]
MKELVAIASNLTKVNSREKAMGQKDTWAAEMICQWDLGISLSSCAYLREWFGKNWWHHYDDTKKRLKIGQGLFAVPIVS